MTTLEINTLMAHMTDLGTPALQAQIRERLVAALYAIEGIQPPDYSEQYAGMDGIDYRKPAGSDSTDAARYRWLRSQWGSPAMDATIDKLAGSGKGQA